MWCGTSSSVGALAALLSTALAQTYTDCNPLQKTCPAEPGLSLGSYSADFTKGSSASASWSATSGANIVYGDNGAEFTITQAGQAPTIATDFYILFGKVEVVMKAAVGTGIVSSIVLQSADLDEIDFEFTGGDNTQVQTNFFGKGNITTYDRAVYHPVAAPQGTWHTYGIDWTSEKIDYLIDGVTVRTIPYSSAQTVNGQNFPQTPMQLKLGNWAGGASPNEGTVEWAGGKTDFSKAPFTMYVKSVMITNYSPACEYTYGDTSGSWQSIRVASSGDSCKAVAQNPSAAVHAPTASHTVQALEQTIIKVAAAATASAHSMSAAVVAESTSSSHAAVPTPKAGSTSASGTAAKPASPSSTGITSTSGASIISSMVTGGSLLSALLGAMLL